jgi:hypothetical protein
MLECLLALTLSCSQPADVSARRHVRVWVRRKKAEPQITPVRVIPISCSDQRTFDGVWCYTIEQPLLSLTSRLR